MAVARFPPTHDVFVDHFPGKPVVPGTLLAEAMAQTAGWLIGASDGFERWPFLVMIDQAKFRRVVGPDQDLQFIAEIQSAHDGHYVVVAETTSRGERVANAKLIFQSFVLDLADDHHRRLADWARQTFAILGGTALDSPSGPA